MFVTTRITSPSTPQRCISCCEAVPNMSSTLSFSEKIKIKTGTIGTKTVSMENSLGYGPKRQIETTTYSYKECSLTAVFPICDTCMSIEKKIILVEKHANRLAHWISIVPAIIITIYLLFHFHFFPILGAAVIGAPLVIVLLIYGVLRITCNSIIIPIYHLLYVSDSFHRKGNVCSIDYVTNKAGLAVDGKLNYYFRNKTYGELFNRENSSIVVEFGLKGTTRIKPNFRPRII